MSKQPYIIVVKPGDPFMRHLGGFPTPMLIDLCNDGKAHEAWPNVMDGGTTQWRARDDAYDAFHKPADVAYIKVMVGRNPYYGDE